jgi:hypothetical protein
VFTVPVSQVPVSVAVAGALPPKLSETGVVPTLMVTGRLVAFAEVDTVVVPTTSATDGAFSVVNDTEPEQDVPSLGTTQPTVAVSVPVGAGGGSGVLPPPPPPPQAARVTARAKIKRRKNVFMGFSFRQWRKRFVEKEQGEGTWGGVVVRIGSSLRQKNLWASFGSGSLPST